MKVMLEAVLELWDGCDVDVREFGDAVHKAIEDKVVEWPVRDLAVTVEFRD